MEEWVGRFLMPRKPLAQVVPNLADLMARPADALARGSVRIAPLRLYRFAGIAVFLSAIAPSAYLQRFDLTISGIGLAVGVALAVLLCFANRNSEMWLRADGLELRYRRRIVWCPWALFNAPGNVVAQTTDHLTLPASPAAVPYVELRRDEEVIAQGMPVKFPLFHFEAADRVVMPCPYEAQPSELGGLLLHLGRALGARAPQGWAPPEAHPPEPTSLPTEDTSAGWVTLPLTRLAFPAECCKWGAPTGEVLELMAKPRGSWIVVVLSFGHFLPGYVNLRVPVCAECSRAWNRAERRGRWGGALAGLVGMPLAVLALSPVLDATGFWIALTLGLLFGPVAGWMAGEAIAQRRWTPVRPAWYSWRGKTVRLRFLRAEYAEKVARLQG